MQNQQTLHSIWSAKVLQRSQDKKLDSKASKKCGGINPNANPKCHLKKFGHLTVISYSRWTIAKPKSSELELKANCQR